MIYARREKSFETKYFSSKLATIFSPPFSTQGPRARDVPPSSRQGIVEVKSDPEEDQELEEGDEGLLVKEEEEERTGGGGDEGERVKTEEKSEARDSIEERRKTEGGGGEEGGEKEVDEKSEVGVKAEQQQQLDANNDSKPLHLDSGQLVKEEVRAALLVMKQKFNFQ